MDGAVAIVETYLRLNGYFTVTEFPVVELHDGADYRTATDLDSLRQGMALTAKLLADFFDKIHVRRIDPVGERFDPEFHQAMSTEESIESEPGTVLRVMQKGYALNERLVRPALVVVAKAAGA